MMTEPTHVDGNAAGGAFAEVLGFDVTTAMLTCAGCGRVTAFAESHVYDRGPGIVVRCPVAKMSWPGWSERPPTCGSTSAAPSPGVSRSRFSDVFADGDMVDRRHQQPITAAADGCTASFGAAPCSIETAAQKGHFAGSSWPG